MKIRKFLTGLLAVCLLTACFPAAALAEGENSYEVYTAEELAAAVEEISEAESGSFEIILKEDITLQNIMLDFLKNEVTLYGEDHTLVFGTGSTANIRGSAVVNLGATDYEKTLTLRSTDDTRCVIGVLDTAVLNMYDHVTICDSSSGGQAGGVQLEDSSQFHLYGGLITNCNNRASVAGGVLAVDSARFVMDGGKITNCSGYQGGAVGVQNQAVFVMNGGEISGCTDHYYGGGAVSAISTQGEELSFVMNGGTISGCSSDRYGYGGAVFMYSMQNRPIALLNAGRIAGNTSCAYGGGLFVFSGGVTIGREMQLFSNAAETAGDDIFLNEGALTLSEPPAGLSGACGHEIDGWYADGVLLEEDTPRWNETQTDDSPMYLKKFTPGDAAVTTQTALKAAHALYSYTIRYYLDGTPEETLSETGVVTVPAPENIPDKCPEGYVLADTVFGEAVPPADGSPGSFEVQVYYVTKTEYSYRIEYYLNGQKAESLSETGTSASAVLQNIPDKCPAGYVLSDTVYETVCEPQAGRPGSLLVKVYYTNAAPVPTAPGDAEQPPQDPAAVDTGDESAVALWSVLLCIAAVLGIVACKKAKNAERK